MEANNTSASTPERGGASPESQEFECPRERRTRVAGDEAHLCVDQSPLPEVCEACQLVPRHLQLDESVHGVAVPVGGTVEGVCLQGDLEPSDGG
jgi:hypothetical protein